MAQKYVATKTIHIGRARVANPDDPIPETHPKLEEWQEAGLVAPVTIESEPGAVGAPAKSAPKADWVTYVTDEARGERQLSTEEAEALTRAELAERFA